MAVKARLPARQMCSEPNLHTAVSREANGGRAAVSHHSADCTNFVLSWETNLKNPPLGETFVIHRALHRGTSFGLFVCGAKGRAVRDRKTL
jgi:hypothetical protein